jgi:hypothetical protein
VSQSAIAPHEFVCSDLNGMATVVSTGVVSVLSYIAIEIALKLDPYLNIQCAITLSIRSGNDQAGYEDCGRMYAMVDTRAEWSAPEKRLKPEHSPRTRKLVCPPISQLKSLLRCSIAIPTVSSTLYSTQRHHGRSNSPAVPHGDSPPH